MKVGYSPWPSGNHVKWYTQTLRETHQQWQRSLARDTQLSLQEPDTMLKCLERQRYTDAGSQTPTITGTSSQEKLSSVVTELV